MLTSFLLSVQRAFPDHDPGARLQLPVRHLHRELREAARRPQPPAEVLLAVGLHRVAQRRVRQPHLRAVDQSRHLEAECGAAEHQILERTLLQVFNYSLD